MGVGGQHSLRIEVHEVQQLAGSVVDLVLVAHAVGSSGVEELLPDGDDRIERGQRRLKHHGAIGPTEAAQPFRVEREDIESPLAVVIPDLTFGDAGTTRR